MIRTVPGSARAVAAAPAPVRRWQRVQWQYAADTNGCDTSNRTAPHPQPPVMGSSIDRGYVRRTPGDARLTPPERQSTGQLTTIGIGLTVACPARTAASTALLERRTRGVAPSFQVTIRTAQSGV